MLRTLIERREAAATGEDRYFWKDDAEELRETLLDASPYDGWEDWYHGGCAAAAGDGDASYCEEPDLGGDEEQMEARGFRVRMTHSWSHPGGYQNGDGLFAHDVLEFEDEAAALGYGDDMMRNTCERILETFRVPGVPGGIGYTLGQRQAGNPAYETDPIIDVVLYTRGPRLYRLRRWTAEKTDHADIVSVATRAEERAR